MGFFAYIILGLIAGAIAKAIMPGTQGGGWIVTMFLGIAGAVVGGWIGNIVFHVGLESFWDLKTWVLSVVGSLVVLFIYGLVTGKKK